MIGKEILRPTLASIALALCLALASCSSAPVVIPSGLEARALIQRAQEASDASKYDLAVRYYEALVDQYGTEVTNLVLAEYEIALITYKQGKTEKAKELFTALLARYQGAGADSLPPLYKILSEKILAKLK